MFSWTVSPFNRSEFRELQLKREETKHQRVTALEAGNSCNGKAQMPHPQQMGNTELFYIAWLKFLGIELDRNVF